MLWDEGQKRLVRERNARETEAYIAARDAYVAGNVALGKAKAKGDITPAYVKEATTGPAPRDQTVTLGRLAAMFPGSVVRRDDS